MPRGMQPFEEVFDFSSSMPPPPVPSRETGDTPIPGWGSPTPSYTPIPSQSQATPTPRVAVSTSHPYRRLAPHEELGMVQLAIQHVQLRQPNNLKPFHEKVLEGFDEAYHWRYKSIPRKLQDLEAYWRIELRRRGSGTGTEDNTDLSQAMEAWIVLMDKERHIADDRATATKQDRSDREVSNRWRNDVVVRQRDRPKVVTHELPADQEFIDLTDDEAAPAPSPSHNGIAAAAILTGAAAAATPATPARPARGRGVTRSPRHDSRRRSSSEASTATMRLFLQLEERRAEREDRRDAAQAAAEERRERREIADREIIMQQMQQMNSLMHLVMQREHLPPQRQLTPASSSPSTFEGALNGNFAHQPEATTFQPTNRFG